MAAKEVEEFARLLIEQVRDTAVSACDVSRSPTSNGLRAKRWQKTLESGLVNELLAEVIPDCVDETLFCLLNAIDQGLLRISFTSASGKTVDLSEHGGSELAGCFMRTEGWRSKYSAERFVDDFADIQLNGDFTDPA